VVLALQESKGPAAGPQCLIPYLGIGVHLINDTIGVGCMLEAIFYCLEVIAIEKARHVDADFAVVTWLCWSWRSNYAVEASGSVRGAHAINS
jgi:hypothetical protein